jgi:GT2 family glycosyltransferase
LIGSKLSPLYGGGIGIGKYQLDNNSYNKNLELDAVNGCMMLVKRQVIDKIGLMDEKYFLYFDDLDWGLRAQRNGFKSIYCHKAVAFHNTPKPYKRFQSSRWLYYAIFNSFYFMKRNYSGVNLFLFFISAHARIIYYTFGMSSNNNISCQWGLVRIIGKAYIEGMRYLWKKE